MLIEKIQKDNILALKNREKNKRTILNVVISKYDLLKTQKNPADSKLDDSDVIKLLQKTLKELDEELQGYVKVGNQERISLITQQKEVLQEYMPKMMNDEEISRIIKSLDDKSLPNVMRYFKSNHSGMVDMTKVKDIAITFENS